MRKSQKYEEDNSDNEAEEGENEKEEAIDKERY